MNSWSDWEIIRRQVCAAGRIVDERNIPVAGVFVGITSAATEKKSRDKIGSPSLEKSGEHNGYTISRWDGLYYFLDLPTGKYTIHIQLDRQVTKTENTVSVTRDKKNKLKVSQMDFTLKC